MVAESVLPLPRWERVFLNELSGWAAGDSFAYTRFIVLTSARTGSNFFIDALKVVDEAEVTLNLSEPNRPAVLRVGTDFLYVIMPVSLS